MWVEVEYKCAGKTILRDQTSGRHSERQPVIPQKGVHMQIDQDKYLVVDHLHKFTNTHEVQQIVVLCQKPDEANW